MRKVLELVGRPSIYLFLDFEKSADDMKSVKNYPLCRVKRVNCPWGYKTWVHSKYIQNKGQWLAACRHVSASSQSLLFILSLRMNSSFITARPDEDLWLIYFSSANKCLLKVAQFAAQLERYDRAIEIYEEVIVRVLSLYNISLAECNGSVGRVLDRGSKGCWFETHHCQSGYSRCLVLVHTRKTGNRLDMTEKLLTGMWTQDMGGP